VLDIGANLGYTTTLFANFIDSNFKVFAFEPDVKNFKHLQRCASSRIEVFQMAVGETSGSITLWHNPNHHADHRVVTAAFKDSLSSDALLFSVPQISIDEFLSSNSVREPLSFIKMDIQGYELPACWGMQETLKNNPNAVIAIEYFPGAMEELGYKAEALLDFFYDRGYELYPFSRRDSLRRLDKANLCDLVRSKGYTDLLASRQKIA
jgi:FkbM family methyltransferase